MIDTELLTEMARDAIVAVDPYRKASTCSSELIAAEKAEDGSLVVYTGRLSGGGDH
jgi:hypothetical protein